MDEIEMEEEEFEDELEIDAVPTKLVAALRLASQYTETLASDPPAEPARVQELAYEYFSAVKEIRTALHEEVNTMPAWEYPSARSSYGAMVDLDILRENARLVRDRLKEISDSLPPPE
eukprot:TRINITY_DN17546_c0_g1_i1.p2 TRINITY_DN17546_c0_g1~~TRINITY_DN17546_c0_g1_i1.p2  ORF type:complete len:118 (+),score=32.73 TRINITY_DN17546_c0_g1_i1:186-539(+)